MPLRPGDQVGRLTLVEPTEEPTSKYRVLWLCRCTCGNEILRQCSSLYNSRHRGHEAACPECNTRAQSERSKAFHAERKPNIDAMRMMWQKYGTLYPDGTVQRIERETMEDLVEEFGPLRDPTLSELGLGAHPATLEEPQPLDIPDGFYDEKIPLKPLRVGIYEEDPKPHKPMFDEEPLPLSASELRWAKERHRSWEWELEHGKTGIAPRRLPKPPTMRRPSIMGSRLPLAALQQKLREVREALVVKLWPHAYQRFYMLTNQSQVNELARLLELDGREAG